MNASKARRRWMRWCRYVAATQSVTTNKNYAGTHAGQVKAYSDVMYARRYAPIGVRAPWYPRWGSVRRG
jgi:hypothetical protein